MVDDQTAAFAKVKSFFLYFIQNSIPWTVATFALAVRRANQLAKSNPMVTLAGRYNSAIAYIYALTICSGAN
jgi:hypothetical protein